MRKIIAGLYISLDGVVESPESWQFPYFNDEVGAIVGAQMQDSDAMLLGRATYQIFAGFWPNQRKDDPFAAYINNVPKYVVSNTLASADWEGTTIIRGNIPAELFALKQQPGKSIAITGSPTLVRSLLRDGLLDELHLLMHPVVIGKGQRLFPDGTDRQPLLLDSARTTRTGVVHLTYRQPVPHEPPTTGA